MSKRSGCNGLRISVAASFLGLMTAARLRKPPRLGTLWAVGGVTWQVFWRLLRRILSGRNASTFPDGVERQFAAGSNPHTEAATLPRFRPALAAAVDAELQPGFRRRARSERGPARPGRSCGPGRGDGSAGSQGRFGVRFGARSTRNGSGGWNRTARISGLHVAG